jgi:hypothetical protein
MIQFYKEPTGLNTVFNNSIFEFGTGSKATIEIGGYTFYISADAQERFYFNAKPVIKVLANQSQFNDSTSLNEAITLDASLYYETEITITIDEAETESRTLKFIKAAYQIEDVVSSESIRLLLPSNVLTVYKDKPIDVSIYSDADRIFSGFNLKKGVNRILLDSTEVKNYFGNGYFEYGYFWGELNDTSIIQGLTIREQSGEVGEYVKWFSRFGGWCFMGFDRFKSERFNTKPLEDISKDTQSISEAERNFSSLGTQLERSINVRTFYMDLDGQNHFLDFAQSPKKFLYKNGSWIEIKTNAISIDLKNRNTSQRFSLDLVLTNNYNQTL